MPPINPTSSVITDQLTRALGEAVIRIWNRQPGNLWNCFVKITMALTCFLSPVVGLMEGGAASGPTIRLKPTSLAGEGSDCAALRRDVSTMNPQHIRP
jgi:hypothetical protein